MANKNLNNAKKAKNDEFYTRISDIERECFKYREQFKDKTIFCNCDDARESKFFSYFALNFEFFGLKRLISTGYKENGHGTLYIYEGDKNGNKIADPSEIQTIELEGNGDFRSPECIEFLKQADIVVTNPPFSLFREYITQLMEYGKKFLVIGNKNALTYNEVFPFIKEGKIWLGRTIPIDFVTSSNEITTSLRGLCRWFTNLETKKYSDLYTLTQTYNPEKYPKYDNYDAINVDKIKDIPFGYEGAMGVPITIADKVCSDGLIHFDTPLLVGHEDSKYKIINMLPEDKKYINQKRMYARTLIQLVN